MSNLLEGYGLTEAGPVLTVTEPGKGLPGVVGRAIPGVELRISGRGDAAAEPGHRPEVAFRILDNRNVETAAVAAKDHTAGPAAPGLRRELQ